MHSINWTRFVNRNAKIIINTVEDFNLIIDALIDNNVKIKKLGKLCTKGGNHPGTRYLPMYLSIKELGKLPGDEVHPTYTFIYPTSNSEEVDSPKYYLSMTFCTGDEADVVLTVNDLELI